MRAIREGLEMVLRRGATVIGPGAMTAPATAGGLKLLRILLPRVTLTNADAYTAAVVARNARDAWAAPPIGCALPAFADRGVPVAEGGIVRRLERAAQRHGIEVRPLDLSTEPRHTSSPRSSVA
jgi:hypothetical protein